jgi:hypothetical protein
VLLLLLLFEFVCICSQPAVVHTLVDKYLDIAVELSRYDVFFVHLLDLMPVVDGYPYHGNLLDRLKAALDGFAKFIEAAVLNTGERWMLMHACVF